MGCAYVCLPCRAMHFAVISNPASPPDQERSTSTSDLEPMSISEDEDIANNNETSLSSSTTESDLSSNLNFGLYGNGELTPGRRQGRVAARLARSPVAFLHPISANCALALKNTRCSMNLRGKRRFSRGA